jgi:hypothetical protein
MGDGKVFCGSDGLDHDHCQTNGKGGPKDFLIDGILCSEKLQFHRWEIADLAFIIADKIQSSRWRTICLSKVRENKSAGAVRAVAMEPVRPRSPFSRRRKRNETEDQITSVHSRKRRTCRQLQRMMVHRH